MFQNTNRHTFIKKRNNNQGNCKDSPDYKKNMGLLDFKPKKEDTDIVKINTGTYYKRRPQDEYKTLLNTLDDETKRKMDIKRTLIMGGVVIVVLVLVIVLALTGVGVNKEGQEYQEPNAFFGLQVGDSGEEIPEEANGQ